jgi:hypothetical protein
VAVIDIVADIESEIVDAGETCPENYQNGFDWPEYLAMLARVQAIVVAAQQLAAATYAVCLWLCRARQCERVWKSIDNDGRLVRCTWNAGHAGDTHCHDPKVRR